jgi:hypothetical protein
MNIRKLTFGNTIILLPDAYDVMVSKKGTVAKQTRNLGVIKFKPTKKLGLEKKSRRVTDPSYGDFWQHPKP